MDMTRHSVLLLLALQNAVAGRSSPSFLYTNPHLKIKANKKVSVEDSVEVINLKRFKLRHYAFWL